MKAVSVVPIAALALLLSSAAPAVANPLTAGAEAWNSERRCALSCHTTVPFMLAAPRLGGRAAAVARSIAERTAARVREGAAARPWYPSQPRRSRGTEAVLGALVLATSGHRDAGAALANLWSVQRADGGWDWFDFGIAPFETAEAEVVGASFAAIATSRAPAAAPRTGVPALRRFLATAERRGLALHEQMFVLWADAALGGVLPAARRRAAVAAIRAAQNPDGGWGIASLGDWRRRDGTAIPGGSDGYATGLAVIALAGERASRDAVARARRWLLDNRRADGSWTGRSLRDSDRFNQQLASHAATGFALLGLSSAASDCGRRGCGAAGGDGR